MMMPDFRPAHTGEKFFGPIGASAVETVSLFMIDPAHFVTSMKCVPVRRIVGVDDGALGDPRLHKCEGLPFRFEHRRNAVAVALANDHHGLALAGLIL